MIKKLLHVTTEDLVDKTDIIDCPPKLLFDFVS